MKKINKVKIKINGKNFVIKPKMTLKDVITKYKIPENKVLIPGVLDTTSNFVEHSSLVKQRIEKFVKIVGKERVIAGTDCGFGTFAGFGNVDPDIAYLKLQSLVEGASKVK